LTQQEEILVLRQENDQLLQQLTALATELANLRERIGRTSRISSQTPSSDGQGFKPLACRKAMGRKRGGQQGDPGSGPELLCRSSAATTCWIATSRPAAAVATPSPIGTR
jgi:hypothetical protein